MRYGKCPRYSLHQSIKENHVTVVRSQSNEIPDGIPMIPMAD